MHWQMINMSAADMIYPRLRLNHTESEVLDYRLSHSVSAQRDGIHSMCPFAHNLN